MTEEPASLSDDPLPVTADAELVKCWRCGKFVDQLVTKCPSCLAKLRDEVVGTSRRRDPSAASSGSDLLIQMLKFYSVMLVVSIVQGFVAAIQGLQPGVETLVFIGIAEFIDTIIVIVAWNSISECQQPTPSEPEDSRSGLWWWLLPVLGILLAINIGYHHVLRTCFQVPLIEDQLTHDPRLLPWWVLVICVQPAVVEELFFRQIAFRAIRTTVSLRATIIVTSAMFGMAHLGSPLSIPILCLIGLALGYFRTSRSGLWLPIVLHFLHNLCILGVQWWI